VNTEKPFVITSLDNPDIIMAVKSFDRFDQLKKIRLGSRPRALTATEVRIS